MAYRGAWTHQLCLPCWQNRNPGRNAYQTPNFPEDRCCACGTVNSSGIYYHERNARGLLCNGVHPCPAPQQSLPVTP